jgi:hypothetical protein
MIIKSMIISYDVEQIFGDVKFEVFLRSAEMVRFTHD